MYKYVMVFILKTNESYYNFLLNLDNFRVLAP